MQRIPPPAPRTALTGGLSLLVAVAAYAILRLVDAASGTRFDPSFVTPGAPVPLFWRLTLTGYLAVALTPVHYMVAGHRPGLTLRIIEYGLPLVAAIAFAQALAVP